MNDNIECARCGDAYGDVDEATEFCPTCFEHEMGEPMPVEDGDLPREVSRGTMKLGGLEIEVVQLDNGHRIIPADSMEKEMTWLANPFEGLGLAEKE